MMKKETESSLQAKPLNRREFIKRAGAGLAILAGSGMLAGCSDEAFETFFQRNFRELSREDLEKILKRLERQFSRKYGRDITVHATPPKEDHLYGYGLDLSRCIGCRRCVYACVEENNLSRNPQVQWIRVLEIEKSKGIYLHESNPYYNPQKVPREDHFYMPVACQQCKNPPCVKTCPVGATWKEPDGIVVVDYNWCIGCRCCMASCPYGARHFNWGEPYIESEDINPAMEYLGNRPQEKGVVSKCTFCIQRVRKGRYPACVEICPVGARKFGNLLDEESEIRNIMKTKRVFILKEELDTKPKFYYFFAT